MAKSLGITMLLAVLVSGVGHIYLGFIKRGIIILIVAIVLAITIPLFIPMPYSWIILIGYWIWQIYDAYTHYKQSNIGQTKITQ